MFKRLSISLRFIRYFSTVNNSMENEMLMKIDKVPNTTVKEGKAEVTFPSTNDVFYNPVQEFNRDISIAVIKEFMKTYSARKPSSTDKDINNVSEDSEHSKNTNISSQNEIKILEALAASGLRSIRYALEIPNVKSIVANDNSEQAVESIRRNIKCNNVDHIVTPSYEDASLFMYQHRQYHSRFHVIDLDPYGSPAPFLDSALQCIADGGLLLVTCTDMAILCGNHSETCHAKYGAVSLKISSCHEMALRIILQSIESHANRYGRYIIPLLSLSVDFYVRVFVKIYTSPSIVKQSMNKLAMVYNCVGCETFHFQPLGKTYKNMKIAPGNGPPVNMACSHCGQKHQIGGPIWSDNIHDKEFVERLLRSIEEEVDCYSTSKRMIGILNVIYEELEDCPLYYDVPGICSVVHCITPNMLEFRSAILNAGYKVSLSHACKGSIQTNAPSDVIWDIIKAWVKLHPIKRDLTDTPAEVILNQKSKIDVDFTLHPDANPTSRMKNLCRFQINPPHWGPKTRAKSSLWSTKQIEKQKKFQGKRSNKTNEDLKQYPCKKFKEGECCYGDECRYSHELSDATAETTEESK